MALRAVCAALLALAAACGGSSGPSNGGSPAPLTSAPQPSSASSTTAKATSTASAAPTSAARPTSWPATHRPTGRPTSAVSPVRPGSRVYVVVAVATLWTSSTAPRAVDAPALRNPVDMRAWLAAMSTATRRDLVGRVETQALYGEQLLVTGAGGSWLHVVATGQATHRDARGYPGWVPVRQVTKVSPRASSLVATVTALTTRLRDLAGRPLLELSFGTRLPVVSQSATRVVVTTPLGTQAALDASAVAVRAPTTPALTRSAAAVVGTAQRFTAVPYLWGGRSAFAVDCSGFTNLVYGAHGVRLPRDADDQAGAGAPVAWASIRQADLVFFTRGTTIGHVGFYIGNGNLLHAPTSGSTVHVSALSSVSGYAGARRYL